MKFMMWSERSGAPQPPSDVPDTIMQGLERLMVVHGMAPHHMQDALLLAARTGLRMTDSLNMENHKYTIMVRDVVDDVRVDEYRHVANDQLGGVEYRFPRRLVPGTYTVTITQEPDE